MRNQNQANLPPMEVRRFDSAERPGNSVDSATGKKVDSIDLLTVARAAAKRLNSSDKELAAIFDLSPSLFSRSFDPHNDTHNRQMKMPLPKEYAEAFVRVMAEMLGLRIGGTEARERAHVELLQACVNYVRAGQL